MSVSAFFTILRPANALVAGLTAVLACLIATGTVVPGTLLLFPVVLLVTGAGNAINDYYDREIDRINRPGRPIPSGAITKETVLRYSLVLFTSGVGLSLFTNPLCTGIAVFNSFLLIAYAARLKALPFIGNLVVSYLSGSIFLFGGAFSGFEGILAIIPIATITFLGTLSREILKDAEDVTGDTAGGATTLPMAMGIRLATLLAFVIILIATGFSIIPAARWGTGYLLLIFPVDLLILAAGIRTLRCESPECIQKSRATTVIKFGMFAALAVFAVAAVVW
jgi:geranylgeranylglycerol-phosphate geranylgeranyltransferase